MPASLPPQPTYDTGTHTGTCVHIHRARLSLLWKTCPKRDRKAQAGLGPAEVLLASLNPWRGQQRGSRPNRKEASFTLT